MTRLRQLDPNLRISNLSDRCPFRRPDDLAKLAEGLRQAGCRNDRLGRPDREGPGLAGAPWP